MYILFKNLHGIFAYLSLVLIALSIAYAMYGLTKKIAANKTSKIIFMMGLSAVHLQLIIGFLIYFLSPLGISNISGEMMKNPVSRLYAMEHPIMMVLGIILVTFGYVKFKKSVEGNAKFRNVAIFYTLGMLCFLSRMP